MSGANLDPDLLRAFLTVADHRSFTRAAMTLNRTQSAVSSQIKRLEDQLGSTLFNRSTARVDLSAAGEGLIGYARRILTLNDEAVQRLRQHDICSRLPSLPPMSKTWLPKLIKDPQARAALQGRGLAGGLQSARFGSTGEDFNLVRILH